MALTIGIDIGTTSTVGILIDTDGENLATFKRDSELISRRPGWAEEEPEQWWRNVGAISRQLVAAAGGESIAAVGVTGMVPAVILLDARDRVLRPSIQQNDARTALELREMAAAFGEERFFALTGGAISQQLVGPKMRWLERHEPETFAAVATLFGSYDFIVHKLTGGRGVERNWALESGLMNLASGAFEAELLALGHVDPAWLPPIRRGEEIVGEITPRAAAETGLKAGTPVAAGCADHVASAFVAGVAGEGDVLIKFGGAGDILLATDTPRSDPRLFIDYHIVPGLYLSNGCMAASGSVLKWIAREFAAAGRPGGEDYATVFARLDAAAAAVPPGAEGLVFLPYFLGEKTPLHDAHARGTLLGLGLHHQLAHVWRAALEAVVFGFRHHIEVFREMGLAPRNFVASNGGALSEVWLRIAADALGVPVRRIARHPGSCLGAAYVAAMAVGAAREWADIAKFTAPGRLFEPDPASRAAYDHAYALFRESYRRLKPLFPKLAGPNWRP